MPGIYATFVNVISCRQFWAAFSFVARSNERSELGEWSVVRSWIGKRTYLVGGLVQPVVWQFWFPWQETYDVTVSSQYTEGGGGGLRCHKMNAPISIPSVACCISEVPISNLGPQTCRPDSFHFPRTSSAPATNHDTRNTRTNECHHCIANYRHLRCSGVLRECQAACEYDRVKEVEMCKACSTHGNRMKTFSILAGEPEGMRPLGRGYYWNGA
jgi:hypothetical protein